MCDPLEMITVSVSEIRKHLLDGPPDSKIYLVGSKRDGADVRLLEKLIYLKIGRGDWTTWISSSSEMSSQPATVQFCVAMDESAWSSLPDGSRKYPAVIFRRLLETSTVFWNGFWVENDSLCTEKVFFIGSGLVDGRLAVLQNRVLRHNGLILKEWAKDVDHVVVSGRIEKLQDSFVLLTALDECITRVYPDQFESWLLEPRNAFIQDNPLRDIPVFVGSQAIELASRLAKLGAIIAPSPSSTTIIVQNNKLSGKELSEIRAIGCDGLLSDGWLSEIEDAYPSSRHEQYVLRKVILPPPESQPNLEGYIGTLPPSASEKIVLSFGLLKGTLAGEASSPLDVRYVPTFSLDSMQQVEGQYVRSLYCLVTQIVKGKHDHAADTVESRLHFPLPPQMASVISTSVLQNWLFAIAVNDLIIAFQLSQLVQAHGGLGVQLAEMEQARAQNPNFRLGIIWDGVSNEMVEQLAREMSIYDASILSRWDCSAPLDLEAALYRGNVSHKRMAPNSNDQPFAKRARTEFTTGEKLSNGKENVGGPLVGLQVALSGALPCSYSVTTTTKCSPYRKTSVFSQFLVNKLSSALRSIGMIKECVAKLETASQVIAPKSSPATRPIFASMLDVGEPNPVTFGRKPSRPPTAVLLKGIFPPATASDCEDDKDDSAINYGELISGVLLTTFKTVGLSPIPIVSADNADLYIAVERWDGLQLIANVLMSRYSYGKPSFKVFRDAIDVLLELPRLPLSAFPVKCIYRCCDGKLGSKCTFKELEFAKYNVLSTHCAGLGDWTEQLVPVTVTRGLSYHKFIIHAAKKNFIENVCHLREAHLLQAFKIYEAWATEQGNNPSQINFSCPLHGRELDKKTLYRLWEKSEPYVPAGKCYHVNCNGIPTLVCTKKLPHRLVLPRTGFDSSELDVCTQVKSAISSCLNLEFSSSLTKRHVVEFKSYLLRNSAFKTSDYEICLDPENDQLMYFDKCKGKRFRVCKKSSCYKTVASSLGSNLFCFNHYIQEF